MRRSLHPSHPFVRFRLLGALSPAKPSAIFRTRLEGASATGFGAVDDDAMIDAAESDATAMVTVGISLEPTAQVEQALAAAKAPAAQTGAGKGVGTGRRCLCAVSGGVYKGVGSEDHWKCIQFPSQLRE